MIALVGMLACRQDDPSLLDVEVHTNPDLPGVATVTWRTEAPGVPLVEYGLDGAFDRSTPAGPAGTEHRVELRGLEHGGRFTLRPVTTIDGDRVEGGSLTLDVGEARADLPRFTRTTWEPDLACGEGYLLTSLVTLAGQSWVVIVDRAGTPVWAWPGEGAEWLFRVRVGRDGESLLWLHQDPLRTTDIARITRMSWDGEVLSETRTLAAHHDFVERPDGGFGWIAYVFAEGMEVDGELRDVATDAILEAPEGAAEGEEAVVFSMFEDYPPGIHDLGLPASETGFLPGWWEFSHANSLLLSDDGATYHVMFRWLDALVEIERATGALRWQLGGIDSDFTGPEGEAFSHAHMSQMGDGRFLVFDNADGTVGISGPAEYTFDAAARTWDRTWEYRNPDGPPAELLLGDARWMHGCDNVLVSWSVNRRVDEVTRDGRVVWSLEAPVGWIVTRLVWIPDLYAAAAAAE